MTLRASAAASFGATAGAVRLHDAKKVHDVKTRGGTALYVSRWASSEITAVMPPIPPGGPDVTFVISVTRADDRDPCAYLDLFRKSTSSRSESPNSTNNNTVANEVVAQALVPCAFDVSPADTQYWGENITLTPKDVVGNGTFANSEGKVPGQVEFFDLNTVTSPRQIEGSTWSSDGRSITLQIPESWRGNGVLYGIQVRRAPTVTDLLPVSCGTHSLNLQLVPKLSDLCPGRAPVAAFWGETMTLSYDLALLPAGAVGRNFGKNPGTVRLEPQDGGVPIVLQPTWGETSISVKLETAAVVQQVLFKVAIIRASEPDPCSLSLIAVGPQALVPQCPLVPGVAVWGQRMVLTYAGSGLPNNKVIADFGAAPGGRVELTNGSGAPVPLTRVWAPGAIDVELPAIAPFTTGVTTISVIRDGEAQACSSLPLAATYIDCSLLGPFLTEAFQRVTVSGSRLTTQQVPLAVPGSVVPVPITRGPIDKTDLRIPESPVTTNQLTQLLTRGIGASIEFGVVASGGSDTDSRQFHTDSGSLTFGSGPLSPTRSILGLMTQPNVVPYPTDAANRAWTLAVQAKVAVPGCPLLDAVVAQLTLTQTPVVVPRMSVFSPSRTSRVTPSSSSRAWGSRSARSSPPTRRTWSTWVT